MKGKIIWLYGLSGSGKTTLADLLAERIPNSERLDGDIVRKTLTRDLGFSIEDRFENIRRIAFVADLLSKHGVNVICSFITPLEVMRIYLRKVLGDRLRLIYIECSLEECIKRDPKGLYAKALSGEIEGMTGLTSPFEIGDDHSINTIIGSPRECIYEVMRLLEK